jgi:hypothetical protein
MIILNPATLTMPAANRHSGHRKTVKKSTELPLARTLVGLHSDSGTSFFLYIKGCMR